MGHKHCHEEREESPILGLAKIPIIHPTNSDTLTCSGLGKQQRKGPTEKKLKRTVEATIGPLIKSDNFSKSPISPHLKLKELARRKCTFSPSNFDSNIQGSSMEKKQRCF